MKINNLTNKNNNQPAFRAYKSVFSKKLNELIVKPYFDDSDIIEISDKFKQVLKTRINNKHLLGEGTRGKIYKIDSEYVLKLPLEENQKYKFSLGKKIYTDLKTYFGETIASFGKIKIIRNVSKTGKQKPIGLPYTQKWLTSTQKTNYYENICFPQLQKLPQKAFDELAKDCALLNSKHVGCKFDYANPNNFIIVGNKVKIVDSITDSFLQTPNDFVSLLKPFLWNMGCGEEAIFSPKLLKSRREVFSKILLASIKHNLPISHGEEYILEEVFEQLCKAKVSTTNFIKKINKIKSDYTKKSSQLTQVEKYLKESCF